MPWPKGRSHDATTLQTIKLKRSEQEPPNKKHGNYSQKTKDSKKTDTVIRLFQHARIQSEDQTPLFNISDIKLNKYKLLDKNYYEVIKENKILKDVWSSIAPTRLNLNFSQNELEAYVLEFRERCEQAFENENAAEQDEIIYRTRKIALAYENVAKRYTRRNTFIFCHTKPIRSSKNWRFFLRIYAILHRLNLLEDADMRHYFSAIYEIHKLPRKIVHRFLPLTLVSSTNSVWYYVLFLVRECRGYASKTHSLQTARSFYERSHHEELLSQALGWCSHIIYNREVNRSRLEVELLDAVSTERAAVMYCSTNPFILKLCRSNILENTELREFSERMNVFLLECKKDSELRSSLLKLAKEAKKLWDSEGVKFRSRGDKERLLDSFSDQPKVCRFIESEL